jgi:hypothetical protein
MIVERSVAPVLPPVILFRLMVRPMATIARDRSWNTAPLTEIHRTQSNILTRTEP